MIVYREPAKEFRLRKRQSQVFRFPVSDRKERYEIEVFATEPIYVYVVDERGYLQFREGDQGLQTREAWRDVFDFKWHVDIPPMMEARIIFTNHDYKESVVQLRVDQVVSYGL